MVNTQHCKPKGCSDVLMVATTRGRSAELGLRPAKRSQKSLAVSQVLPMRVALTLLNDTTFAPGPRPEHFYHQQCSETQWIFKEAILANRNRLKKRKFGSDMWVNSGGKVGGRTLTDGQGVAVARVRYGTIKTGSDGDAARLRYQQYTLIRDGKEDTRIRIFHVHEVSPAITVPSGVSLTQAEQAEVEVLYSSGKAKRDRSGQGSQNVARETRQLYCASHTNERRPCPKHPKLSSIKDTGGGGRMALARAPLAAAGA